MSLVNSIRLDFIQSNNVCLLIEGFGALIYTRASVHSYRFFHQPSYSVISNHSLSHFFSSSFLSLFSDEGLLLIYWFRRHTLYYLIITLKILILNNTITFLPNDSSASEHWNETVPAWKAVFLGLIIWKSTGQAQTPRQRASTALNSAHAF